MKYISVNIIILTIFFCMQSCIKEDISECKNSVLQLRFRYTLNGKYSDLFGSEVRRLTAYIFNSDGKYVESHSVTGEKLVNNYIMTIPLPEGHYQAVIFCDNAEVFSTGWIDNRTNLFYKGFLPGITAIADFRIMLNSMEGPDGFLVPVSTPGDLYVGFAANVSSTNNTSIADVYLMKDTKDITVKFMVQAFPAGSVVMPEIYITGTNGRFKSDNSIDTYQQVLKYTPYKTTITGDTVSSYIKTMRIVTGQAPMLVIKHPSIPGNIFSKDITELILSNPKYTSQEDIDREDRYVFEINFSQTGNNIVIIVSINGWEINTVIPIND